jgi:hypothetical protein
VNGSKQVVLVSFVLAGVMAVVSMFAIATPTTFYDNWALFHLPLAISSAYAVLHIGAAALLLKSLRVYKTKLKQAYILISASLVFLALATIQLLVLNGFGLWESAWAKQGGIGIPFMLAGIFAYGGTRLLARLIGESGLLTFYRLVLPVIVGLCVLLAFLPHTDMVTESMLLAFNMTNGVLFWSGLLFFVSAILMIKISGKIGAHYRNTMVLLMYAFMFSFISLGGAVLHRLVAVDTQDYFVLFVNSIGLVAGFLFLAAGYEFTMAESFKGRVSWLAELFGFADNDKKLNSLTRANSALEMVVASADLVSKQQEIDPLLDKVRVITAFHEDGQKLTPKDESSLIKIYLQIEEYLVNKEVLRNFTRSELRARLNPRLATSLKSYE